MFCKNQATSLAEDFLSEMMNQLQLKPNHVFYASLLYAYSRRRDYPNVFYTFDRLERAGFTLIQKRVICPFQSLRNGRTHGSYKIL